MMTRDERTESVSVDAVAISPSRSGADFDELAANVRSRVEGLTRAGAQLFTTDVDGDRLAEEYVAAFDAEARQVHNCRACKQFIKSVGGLVFIDEQGFVASAAWAVGAPSPYQESVARLRSLVENASVNGVFVSELKVIGKPVTGPWTHFSIEQGKPWSNPLKTAHQEMAEKKQDYLAVVEALREFPAPVVDQAVSILRSESLYRSEKVLGVGEWFHALHTARNATKHNGARTNLIWRAVASAPAGFAHIKSGMIGTLLEDIAAKYDFETIRRRFSEKMNPLQYQRPQAAPTAGNIAQAEKVIAELQATGALRRRYAKVTEVHAIWRPRAEEQKSQSGGVFSHLIPREDEVARLQLPVKVMTWVKFRDTILSEARTIEYQVPPGAANYSAFLTTADQLAPPIVQWDRSEARNPISWYVYAGGSTPDRWTLKAGDWVQVTAVCPHPDTVYHPEDCVFFLLHGAQDKGKPGLALFPEILKTEFHPIRATIEAFSQRGVLEGADDASACGFRLQKGTAWNSGVLKVTTASGVERIRLDRWD